MNFGGSQGSRITGYKRRRILTGIANYMRNRRPMRGAAILRSIGAPALLHTFARPGQRLRLTNDGNNYYIEGAALASSNAGGQYGINIAGVGPALIRGANNFGLAQFFQFSYLNAVSDLANLYDNYRIKAVRVNFDLSYNNAPGETSNTNLALPFSPNSLPMMHYCVDVDDNTAPASPSTVLEFSKSRTVRLGDRPVSISFVPRAQGVVSTSSVASPGTGFTPALGSMLPVNTWLDCQNGQTVPHFGLKMFFENMPIGTNTTPGQGSGQWNWVLTISPVYYLECKNIH